jgi:hypothetical protein
MHEDTEDCSPAACAFFAIFLLPSWPAPIQTLNPHHRELNQNWYYPHLLPMTIRRRNEGFAMVATADRRQRNFDEGIRLSCSERIGHASHARVEPASRSG